MSFIKNNNIMSIHLPINLHEKMEYVISQYIGELHHAGIIEQAKEHHRLNINFEFINYELFMIRVLFDNNIIPPTYNRVGLFNQIANNYFIKEDKNELQKYFNDYLIQTRWSKKRKENWLESSNDFMYMIAYMFAKTNKKFIMEQIEFIGSNVALK